jgi:hypothetical protein
MILVAGGFTEAPVPFENTNWLMMRDQQLRLARSRAAPEVCFQNFIPCAQTGCERAKMPPYWWSILGPSIFAEWGLSLKRILVAGCSE